MGITISGYGYSLVDMCQIADFDFFSNPFIPGQPLDYYTKFLKPLHDVLAAYKKVWTNALKAGEENPVKYLDELDLPTKTIDGYERRYDGPDRIQYLGNLENWKKQLQTTKDTTGSDYATLGYQVNFQFQNGYWDKYGTLDDYTEYFEGRIFTKLSYRNSQKYISTFPFPAGLTYNVYLYHITSYERLWNYFSGTSSYSFRPSYFQSPYDMVIDMGSGTVPSTRFITLDLALPDTQIKADFTDIPVQEFYRYNYTSYSEYTQNPNKYLYEGIISCFYRPMIVVDFSSRFQYK